MIRTGVYPAAVTPFDEKGRIDMAATARLLAWFESEGCTGAVLAGTNGEGPSLSAPEKRDFVLGAMALRGKLDLILGIATPSLDEAVWLCKQAAKFGCVAVLVMPPFYFRDASPQRIEDWMKAVLDASPCPVIVYNFPQKAGITLPAEMLGRLGKHSNCAGVKDSSGFAENLVAYRQVLDSDRALMVGDETLLIRALDAGWTGSISGAANVLPNWLSEVVRAFHAGEHENSTAKFELVLPSIQLLRKQLQPAMNKALLQRLGVLPSDRMRLPLEPAAEAQIASQTEALESALGLRFPLRA
jgi:dihydrodipicolinate synthase/N-acetylneuraminate lyase